jgi:predicted AAA+ superfamily ATPase
MLFKRVLDLNTIKTSSFLFGPRLTGKTTLLKSLSYDAYFDLLDPQIELEYRTQPVHFWQQLSAIPENARIIVDEIQKVPSLLNYVQMAIDRLHHKFILSGSSARKLRRGGANLLGGRAFELRLFPLTYLELEKYFSITYALSYGTLPMIASLLQEKEISLVCNHLRSYVSVYLKEEIQIEALTRNLGAFNRFLNVCAQSNGQIIEFSNISRECSVPASTVKEYYQILEDTLLGFFLWPFDYKERRKARPKFYFFDCGVLRAIQNRLNDPPTSIELGILFETWFINEIMRINSYQNYDHQFSFWRNRDHEIDIIISRGQTPILAIECKSGNSDIKKSTILTFEKFFQKVKLIVASLSDERPRKIYGLDVLPFMSALNYYQSI